eukprot:COSAG01_NODE_3012_length_6723_cov_13.578351_1_plen_365_part_00
MDQCWSARALLAALAQRWGLAVPQPVPAMMRRPTPCQCALLAWLAASAGGKIRADAGQGGSSGCWCASGSCTTTPLGTICGGASAASAAERAAGLPDVEYFFGVRYANIPRRFAPAELASEPWSEQPYLATQVAPSCFSGSWEKPLNHSWGNLQSEDCLFVDILRPATEGSAAGIGGSGAGGGAALPPPPLLPVAVWVHGGGMMGGASNSFDFTRFVQTQRVIVVAVNYRLGPLGFFSSAELEAENHHRAAAAAATTGRSSGAGSGGMNGQLDQITALRWVKRHISGWGGDAQQVTLFGQSACVTHGPTPQSHVLSGAALSIPCPQLCCSVRWIIQPVGMVHTRCLSHDIWSSTAVGGYQSARS